MELRAIDRPVPKASEVLVRVHAAGLDRGVWHVMTGLPCMIRFIGFGVCGDPRSASGAWTSPDGSRRSASR
jgi:NADPH:quinone reductase-like Zn-dependent oxidoreductase